MKKDETTTKRTFVAALEELLKEQPLEKITIGDITEYCKVSRRSFYNYFTDINDLILYAHRQAGEAMALLFPKMRDTRLAFTMLFTYVREHRAFYERAFRHRGYNSFYDLFYADTLKFNIAYLDDGNLTPDVIFAIQFLSNGVVFTTEQWVKTGMVEEPEVIAERLMNCYPVILEKYKQ